MNLPNWPNTRPYGRPPSGDLALFALVVIAVMAWILR